MSALCEVVFLPGKERVEVLFGSTLMEASRLAGISIEAQCNGLGRCGKCRVKAEGELSRPGEEERVKLGPLVEEGIRLACKATVKGPVRVELEGARRASIVENGEKLETEKNPWTKIVPLEDRLTEPGSSWWSGMLGAFSPDSGSGAEVMRRFAETFNSPDKIRPLAVVRGDKVIDIGCEGDEGEKRCFGIALDIGTTSMVAEMVNLSSGETVDIASSLNPQVAYGGDVLTRITYAMGEDDGTASLQAAVVGGINGLIEQLAESNGISRDDIYEMTVAANTTMLHLLMGVSPRSLAVSPYHPVFTGEMSLKPDAVKIRIAGRGVVTLMPSVSAFVGSDIVSGIVVTGFHRLSTPSLFIDIGTNGEIVILKEGEMLGSSSAAGPALEGMNISCGSRAEKGAIERVRISERGELILDTIGNAIPTGLCGSGLVDIIAELVVNGAIEPGGRFAAREKTLPMLSERLIKIENKRAFLISEENRVILTQKDIRQVQLAKGAMAAGISLLLQKQGLKPDDIENVFVAGAFGAHLKPESLLGIGLLPAAFAERIRFVGNTSKEGARALMLNRNLSGEIRSVCERIKIMELSSLPEFQKAFVEHMGFPSRQF